LYLGLDKRVSEIGEGECAVLEYPGTIAGEGVASVNEVAMPGEAGQQVAHTLQQSVHLRMDQHFCHQVLGGILYQPLTVSGFLSFRGLTGECLKFLLKVHMRCLDVP
jgi:hypothetical protein